SNNIIRYHRRSSRGFGGTRREFRSFEVRGWVLYRPTAKHCSNNILQREHRSSKGFAGTHVEICCIHSFGAWGLRLYPLGAMLCSNNIIRYNRRSSKAFAGTRLEFRSFEVRGLVLYRRTAKHSSNNILQRELL